MKLRNIAATMRHLRAGRVAVAAGNVLACSGLIGFIACADQGPTEPGRPAAVAVSSRVSATVVPNWWAPPPAVIKGDTVINVFTMDPAQGATPTFGNGGRLVIPANAICDPLTSGYGPKSWAKSCALAKTYLTFTVRSWKAEDGSPRVTFLPDVRFAPSQTVLLYLGTGSSTSTSGKPVIQWCTSLMTQCVNESLTDPSLATTFDPFAYSVWRRVKHLSGYNTVYGRVSGAVQY